MAYENTNTTPSTTHAILSSDDRRVSSSSPAGSFSLASPTPTRGSFDSESNMDMSPFNAAFRRRGTQDRGSFSSVREQPSQLAQTFTSSKISSYAVPEPPAAKYGRQQIPARLKPFPPIDTDCVSFGEPISPVSPTDTAHHNHDSHDSHNKATGDSHHSIASASNFTIGPGGTVSPSPSTPSPQPANVETMTEPMLNGPHAGLQYNPPLIFPGSKLHGYFFPSPSFRGWKQISVRGRAASRSYGDLQTLNMTWNPQPPEVKKKNEVTAKSNKYSPGTSPIERLPYELLRAIFDLLVLDIPTHGVTARNVDLMSMLLTSRTMHVATLNTLYRNITVPHSRIFRKFLAHIRERPTLGTIVRRIDFSHFNPSTIFSTPKERAATQDLTSATLLECLSFTPYLQEFLGQEYMDVDMDVEVLKTLFFRLPCLQALDFCGCTSLAFKGSVQALVDQEWPDSISIRRLSLHKCMSLRPQFFELLLPRLHHLTILDLANTQITDKALSMIPPSANLTHLNLAKCSRLSSRAVIDFFKNHPATRSLQFLSLGMDAVSNQLLSETDVSELLPLLPSTLKSLSIKGSRMQDAHIPMLRRLAKHLEELALGRGFTLKQVDRLFSADKPKDHEMDVDMADFSHSLRYIDLSDMFSNEFDLVHLFGKSPLMKTSTLPLEVIEISNSVANIINRPTLRRSGWEMQDFGRRFWIVRVPDTQTTGTRLDDGRRPWKWGASYWGMRKVPVAVSDVGGMYGSFMFNQAL